MIWCVWWVTKRLSLSVVNGYPTPVPSIKEFSPATIFSESVPFPLRFTSEGNNRPKASISLRKKFKKMSMGDNHRCHEKSGHDVPVPSLSCAASVHLHQNHKCIILETKHKYFRTISCFFKFFYEIMWDLSTAWLL